MLSATRGLALTLALALAPLGLLALAAPALRIPPLASALLAFAVASLSIVFGTAVSPVNVLAQPRTALATAAVGVTLGALAFALPLVPAGFASSLGVIACACALGAVVGTRVAAPGHLLAVALVSAAVDLWSVTSPSGVTHAIVRNPRLAAMLTVSAAVPPSRMPLPVIGFGDAAFAALYLAVATRFNLSRARTAVAVAAGLMTAGVLAMALRAPVPALPMLGAAVVLAHPEARQVPRRDRTATWIAAALLVASAVRAALR